MDSLLDTLKKMTASTASSNSAMKNTAISMNNKPTTSATSGIGSLGATIKEQLTGSSQKPTTSDSGGSSGSGTSGSTSTGASAGTSTTNWYKNLLDYFKTNNEAARKSAIDAITARINAQKDAYNNQIEGLGDQYQALRNQSEVERYKSRGAMREALANRGQLDSGYGRQEQLLMDTQYGNAINAINLQEQQARNEIKNLIQQLIAEGEADKTTVNNQYNQALNDYIAQMKLSSQ